MEYGGTHVRKLSQLSVGDELNRLRIGNDSRVGNQHAGNIGPVFIDIDLCSLGDNGAGDIGTATGEGLYPAVLAKSVEAGDDGLTALGQSCSQSLFSLVGIELAFIVEEDDLSGVDELDAKIGCHDFTVEEFTAGCGIVLLRLGLQCIGDFLEILIQGEINSEALDDFIVSCLDSLYFSSNILAICCSLIYMQQHISDLGIIGESLAGSRGNNEYSGLIGLYNCPNLLKLLCTCQ